MGGGVSVTSRISKSDLTTCKVIDIYIISYRMLWLTYKSLTDMLLAVVYIWRHAVIAILTPITPRHTSSQNPRPPSPLYVLAQIS